MKNMNSKFLEEVEFHYEVYFDKDGPKARVYADEGVYICALSKLQKKDNGFDRLIHSYYKVEVETECICPVTGEILQTFPEEYVLNNPNSHRDHCERLIEEHLKRLNEPQEDWSGYVPNPRIARSNRRR